MGRRMRLDKLLFERGLMRSRAQARDAILRGAVSVDGALATKPAAPVAADADIVLDAGTTGYVSRGAVKLAAALEGFGFDATGRICLDIGASTGGFTELLLQRGAAKIYAVDVGHGQLHASLAGNDRIVSLEGTDARGLTPELIAGPVSAIVADVSFISLTQALGPALDLAAPGAWLAALVKPQFEAGRGGVGKSGIVRDCGLREKAVTKVRDWLTGRAGWRLSGALQSPIAGRGGNAEFWLGAVHDR